MPWSNVDTFDGIICYAHRVYCNYIKSLSYLKKVESDLGQDLLIYAEICRNMKKYAIIIAILNGHLTLDFLCLPTLLVSIQPLRLCVVKTDD